MRVLILGGTTEAREIAASLAGDRRFTPVLSLAGRTARPLAHPVATRVGGFGGAEGLAAWLATERIDALLDATHPYAAQISANAVKAVRTTGIPLGSLHRPAWQPVPGDAWIEAASPAEAVTLLGRDPRRVLLTLGRLDLSTFAAAPQHDYVARTIDPPGGIALPPRIAFIRERGPFTLDNEIALLRRERTDVLVSKNSGGAATYAKIEAARRLNLRVVMISRPEKPHGEILDGAAPALQWLDALYAAHHGPRSERGV